MTLADRGADTQSRFHYQTGYGVLLLSKMLKQQTTNPSRSLVCEYRDDFLLENVDGSIEAIQVKTRKVRSWTLNSPEIRQSLSRFLCFDSEARSRFERFHLVSNVPFPKKLEELVEYSLEHWSPSRDELPKELRSLANSIPASTDLCLSVLRRLSLVEGPALRDWRSSIVCHDIADLPGYIDGEPACSSLTLAEAEKVFHALYMLVDQASEADNPAPLDFLEPSQEREGNPPCHKRITVADAHSAIRTVFEDLARLRAMNRRDLDFPHIIVPPLLMATNNSEAVPEFTDAPTYGRVSRLDFSDLITQPALVSNVKKRAETNCDVLERFHSATKHMTTKPAVRMYGNFTALSTDRASSSDYDTLIRYESELVTRLIRDGYPVFIFANLLPSHILQNWTDSTRMWARFEAMCEQLQRLEDRHDNLKITIDSANRFPSRFILGDTMLIESASSMHNVGYTQTFYTNTADQVAQSTTSFDSAFRSQRVIERAVRDHLHIDTASDYLTTVFQRRVDTARR